MPGAAVCVTLFISVYLLIAGWCSGSTSASEAEDAGSIPAPASIFWVVIMLKRIVSFLLVVSLVISASCITSSAFYDLDDDTTVVPFMLDTGVSVAAVEPSDLDYYLEFSGSSVAKYLAYILYALTGSTTSMSSSVYTFLDSIDDQLLDQYSLLGSMSSFLSNISGNSNLIKISLDAIEDDVSIFEARLNSVISWLTSVNTSLATVNTSVNTVDSSVNSMSDKLTGSSNVSYLGVLGQPVTYSTGLNLATINRMGFMGLASHFRAASGSDVLLSNGTPGQTPADVTYSYLFRYGLLGLRSLLSGSETDNVYSSTLNDNNNTTTTVNSTGLGPLLNTQLSNIGENLGHLAYIFASDDDIKLKQDSKPLLDETDSFYDASSDSKVKVSAGDVGSFKGFGSDMLDIVDTGADIGDVVTILSNANSFRWFTPQTAADLDSIGTATISDEESTYDRLHREFNEIYFPDRVGGGN